MLTRGKKQQFYALKDRENTVANTKTQFDETGLSAIVSLCQPQQLTPTL
ncbi:MAG: hypothetical protein KTR17_07185 [Cellvibrionaceae bacterium]|nr:hypothetical protein [Cellvibrionaceae bacterium]